MKLLNELITDYAIDPIRSVCELVNNVTIKQWKKIASRLLTIKRNDMDELIEMKCYFQNIWEKLTDSFGLFSFLWLAWSDMLR